MFLLKSLYHTVIISNTLDYLFQYLLQSFYYIFMVCAATCTRSVPFFADTCTHSVPIFYTPCGAKMVFVKTTISYDFISAVRLTILQRFSCPLTASTNKKINDDDNFKFS